VTFELSAAYDEEARKLLREAGLEDRSDRRLRDIADGENAIEDADVVVLHRVVCCYPDYERLLTAVVEHARRLVVFSYPRRNGLSRLVVAVENLSLRLRGREFRVFAHPPAAMLGVLTRRGLRRTFDHHGLVWQVAGLER
jgi:magnesium-protoporphyrin O-methyltransferase